MKAAVYSGSFDPFTNGHLDLLERACRLFDIVYVAVLVNANKRCVFTPMERKDMIEAVVAKHSIMNAKVVAFDGLLAELARELGANYIVRGLRSSADYDYELPMERANGYLGGGLETVYLSAKPELAFISSSAVREIGSFGGDISGLTPEPIKKIIAERLIKR